MPRTASLPRDTRDTFLILGVVALVLLPQVVWLPLWASALAGAWLAWRGWLNHRRRQLPGKWQLAAWLALAVTATALQFHTIVGPEAGVVLVVLLLPLKTLEMRARRDAMVIFFLGFFTLLTLFLQSQSLSMAVAMWLAVWGLMAALLNAHLPAGYPSVGQLLRTSGSLMLLGTPIMLLLFLSFPRFAPLWGVPTTAPQGRTGLSNAMHIGQVAELAHQRSVALRVRFDTPAHTPPPQHLLYFRGPVLSEFDGRSWQASDSAWPAAAAAGSDRSAQGWGPTLHYQVTLEPHQQRWLLTLDATLSAPQTSTERRLLSTPDLQWLAQRPITEVLRYQAQAHVHFAYDQALSATQRHHLVQLPHGRDPRTRAWAQQLRATHGHDDSAIVQAALHHLRSGGFRYTLQPGTVDSPHTADDFWFERQQGFCEHIASAFAVLMRAAGIPARIVTGYQGGERNPVDGLWTVRQSDAHAWTEVWMPQQGWLRIDPTTAVAPSRTELLQRLLPPTSLLENTVGTVLSHNALQQLRANWEAINHRWNDWVLNYTRSEQLQLLQRLGLQHWPAAHIAGWLGCVLAMALACWGLLRWHRRHRADPWLRLVQQARQRCARAGLPQAPQLGLQALARAAQAHWGDESLPLQVWLRQMEQWRYAPHSTQTLNFATLKRSYRALRWPRRSRTP